MYDNEHGAIAVISRQGIFFQRIVYRWYSRCALIIIITDNIAVYFSNIIVDIWRSHVYSGVVSPGFVGRRRTCSFLVLVFSSLLPPRCLFFSIL